MSITLETLKQQLIANNEEQIATTDSVAALTKVFIDRFKLEDRQRLDELEASMEGKKRVRAPSPSSPNSKEPAGGGFDLSDLMNRFALPAVVALAASMAGFDAAIKALRIPAILTSIRTALNAIKTTFDNLKTKALSFVDRLKLIKFPDLPRLTVTFPESWTKLGTTMTNAIKAALPTLDDLKLRMPKLTIPSITTFYDNLKLRVGNIFPSLDDLKLKLPKITLPDFDMPKFPRITFPEMPKLALPSLTTFYDNLKLRVGNIFPTLDDLKLKLPKIALPDFDMPKFPKITFPDMPKFSFLGADGKPFKFPSFAVPDALKNLKMPDFSAVSRVLKGVDGTSGILGFFSWIGTTIANIPGLKSIARLVGGPVTQAIISLIDFFVGFYKGFTTPELDADGNEIVRTFGDRMLDGVEGGLDGVLKGIVAAFQLVLVDLPKWLLGKMGVDTSWLAEIDLWSIVSPIWEFMKAIPKFLFSREYRDEQIARVKTEWEAAGGLSGIFWTLWDGISTLISNAMDSLPSVREVSQSLIARLPRSLRPDTDAELRADANAKRYELEDKIAEERARIARSRSGVDEYQFFEAGGIQQSERDIARHLRAIERLNNGILALPVASELTAAQQAANELKAQSTIIINNIDQSNNSRQNSSSQSSFTAPASAVDNSLPMVMD